MYSPYERLYHLLAYVPGDHTTYFDRARRVIPLIWPYSRLFHLSNRVPGLYTLVWPKRDLFPLANVYSVYIDPLPISTTYYTQDTYSFFLDKFQIFPGFSPPVCVPPLPTATPRIKREILMLLARRVSILRCTLGGARIALVSNENRSIFISRKEQSRLP